MRGSGDWEEKKEWRAEASHQAQGQGTRSPGEKPQPRGPT